MTPEEFKEIGIDEKQIRVLNALKDGAKNGPEIEKLTGLRQPEVSRAVKELRTAGYVKLLRGEKRFKQGAPCKIWTLTKPYNEIIKDLVGRKLVELDRKLRIAVRILFEVGEPISNVDPEIVKAIQELKDDDVLVVELKSNKEMEKQS